MLKIVGLNSKWDERFVGLARYVSTWSKDPRAKVGAVVVTNEGGAIALGYNGFPSGIQDDDRLNDKYLKRELIIHAEQNALLTAGSHAKGATLYVWGKPVCARCAAIIIQAGVFRIVSTDPKKEDNKDSDWAKSGVIAEQMFVEANRAVDYYELK